MNERIHAVPLPREPYPCPYLPDLVADFEHYLLVSCNDEAFCRLLESGFRRFGNYFFRPACKGACGRPWCGACLPLRVVVADFTPSKSQRRVLHKGREVVMKMERPDFSEQKYELYLRHKERFQKKQSDIERGGEDDSSAYSKEAFKASFYAPNPYGWECAYFVDGRLAGVGFVDLASRLLSSIYFFFDPDYEHLSLGSLSVLREVELARSRGIPYYYLGYTIQDNPSMRYKMAFRPSEVLDGRSWRLLRDERGQYALDPGQFRTGVFTPLFRAAERA